LTSTKLTFGDAEESLLEAGDVEVQLWLELDSVKIGFKSAEVSIFSLKYLPKREMLMKKTVLKWWILKIQTLTN
jgi:hypothetical protein